MTSAFDGFVLNRVALAVGQVTNIDPAAISSGTRLTEDLALGQFGSAAVGNLPRGGVRR
jgi:hypothetical protein